MNAPRAPPKKSKVKSQKSKEILNKTRYKEKNGSNFLDILDYFHIDFSFFLLLAFYF